MEYTVENKLFGTVLAIGRYVMMICLYIGAGCVIYCSEWKLDGF